MSDKIELEYPVSLQTRIENLERDNRQLGYKICEELKDPNNCLSKELFSRETTLHNILNRNLATEITETHSRIENAESDLHYLEKKIEELLCMLVKFDEKIETAKNVVLSTKGFSNWPYSVWLTITGYVVVIHVVYDLVGEVFAQWLR